MTGPHQALLYSEINCQKIGAGTSLDGNERDMRVKSKMATKTLKISPEFDQIRINWHRSRKKIPTRPSDNQLWKVTCPTAFLTRH